MVLGELALLQQGVCHGSPVMSGSSVLVPQNACSTGNGLAVHTSAMLDDAVAAALAGRRGTFCHVLPCCFLLYVACWYVAGRGSVH
jgi:hypothetical protein